MVQLNRRPLLALAPLAALSACAGPSGDDRVTPSADPGAGHGSDGPDTASSDGGGAAASDGGGTSASDSGSHADTAQAGSAAEAAADRLSTRDLAAQLVLIGVTAGAGVPTAVLRENPVGGVFFIGIWKEKRTVEDTLAQIRDALGTAVAPLCAVDQEGGQIRMLRGDAARNTPSAEKLGKGGPDTVRTAYMSIGEDLSARGFSCALAPVADVVDPSLANGNAPVGDLDRGFGTDPDQVAACVDTAVRALDQQGIAATLKHFPGLGRIEQNTDHSADGIHDTATERGDAFLEPFRVGIDAGARLVMLSSAIYPKLDPDSPAMFSPRIVTDVLRGDLGFDGLVITDDIGAAKAVAHVPVPQRAVRLLEAGGDAVLTADPSLAAELIDAITAWAQQGAEQKERLRASALRMLRLKEELGLLDG